jgi:hypothetical protein
VAFRTKKVPKEVLGISGFEGETLGVIYLNGKFKLDIKSMEELLAVGDFESEAAHVLCALLRVIQEQEERIITLEKSLRMLKKECNK